MFLLCKRILWCPKCPYFDSIILLALSQKKKKTTKKTGDNASAYKRITHYDGFCPRNYPEVIVQVSQLLYCKSVFDMALLAFYPYLARKVHCVVMDLVFAEFQIKLLVCLKW